MTERECQIESNRNMCAGKLDKRGFQFTRDESHVRAITNENSVSNLRRIPRVSKDFPRVRERINRLPRNSNKKAKKLQRMKETLGIRAAFLTVDD